MEVSNVCVVMVAIGGVILSVSNCFQWRHVLSLLDELDYLKKELARRKGGRPKRQVKSPTENPKTEAYIMEAE